MNQPSQNFTPEENQSEFTPPPSQPFSNPFTGDMKGEFNSNFGTGTNAVSQIFREGGFVGDNRKKIALIALAVVLLGGGAYYLLSSSSESTEDQEIATTEESTDGAADTKAQEEEATVAKEESKEATTPEATAASEQMSGTIALSGPANGQTRDYDEVSQGAEFTWEGPTSVTIIFARDEAMKNVERRVKVEGKSYQFLNPYPGTWYWKVESANGETSETRSFTVNPPVRRNLTFTQPSAGGTIAGNGGLVSWQSDSQVAYYRVEFSSSNQWSAPTYVFASSGSQVALKNVTAGKYFVRLGGFSEVSGQWEYSTPVEVTVQ